MGDHDTNDNQVAFDRAKQPIAISWPEVFQETPAMRVLHNLQDFGVPILDERKLLALIQSGLDTTGGNELVAALLVFVDWLVTAKPGVKPSPESVGKLVFVLAYLLRTPHAAKNLEQLGVMIGVKKTQAHNRVKQVNALMRDLLGNLIKPAPQTEQEPH